LCCSVSFRFIEDCPNNELYQYLMEKGKLEEAEVRQVFGKILEGVKYLHEHKIIYRDIKLENILIDAYGEVKISDFGLSKPRCEQSDITYTYCGSPEYMAPEMLMK
jgi:serine/threonine protein kinase